MGLLVLTFGTLFISTFADYHINLNDATSSVTYNYESPQDFTYALVKVKLNLDYSYYNKLSKETGSTGPVDIITVRSPSGDNDLFDYLAFQLLISTDGLPLLMVIISSPLASGDFGGTTYCINLTPYDFAGKLITVKKTGRSFTLDIEGLEKNDANYHCQGYPDSISYSGKMDLSTVIIGPNLVGCASILQFPNIDLLPQDKCGFPVEYFSGDITYFEGTCSSVPAQSVVCPLPTTKPKVVTQKQTEPKRKETQKPTQKPTPEPEPLPVPDPKPEPQPDTTKPEEETKDAESKPEDNVVVVVSPDDNDTEEKENSENEYEITETGASTGDELEGTSNSVVIIICVVSAGIIVIVVLLYVGYRFHFRDKGSYKLEETKGEPQGEDFGNEYTDLNPTTKDQEWYL